MNHNAQYRRLMLALMSTLSVIPTHAGSAGDATTSLLQSPSYFYSSLQHLKQGHATVQLGGHWAHQGRAQSFIDIDDLIGDRFTVTSHQSSNGLVGAGYYIDGQEKNAFSMSYGLNFFYLAKTSVKGDVVQENLYTNLSYHYSVTHYPLYAIAKATIDTKSPNHGLTVDVGIGPNFMQTGYVYEHPVEGSISDPDDIFGGRNTTTFSATAGIGIKFNNAFGSSPLECGYRFFYLGQGGFKKQTGQVINTLNTGTAYANAIMCAITL